MGSHCLIMGRAGLKRETASRTCSKAAAFLAVASSIAFFCFVVVIGDAVLVILVVAVAPPRATRTRKLLGRISADASGTQRKAVAATNSRIWLDFLMVSNRSIMGGVV